jgi:hypothetical protein
MGGNKNPEASAISQSEFVTSDKDQAATVSTRARYPIKPRLDAARCVRDLDRQDQEGWRG